ncbi:hypothetical protein [Chryseobacterium sp. AG363]|uniref:hypothetical protein n=1 Tax=Chryseobacterium sp. AG363 TaxID=2183997 RepID=UPI000E74B6D6|nr:hypothetical protein [Chryseobacterium sp. AG363]RKE77856.1 hypothetical protein DEU39_3489 [Chryseobacterium sp. AG363]
MKIDISNIVQKLSQMTIKPRTFYVGLPIIQIKKMNKKEVMHELRNPDRNLYKKFTDSYFEDIEEEKKKVIQNFNKFLHEKIDSLNVIDIIERINEWIIRIEKLILIYDPKYYRSVFEKKGSGFKYDKVKIVWIDSNGIKDKNTTRTFGQIGEESLKEIMKKFLVTNENAKNPREEERIKVVDGFFISDLIVEIDREDWIFEFKMATKDDYIQEAVRKEIWELYKKEYNL